jgi:hypothetical protein
MSESTQEFDHRLAAFDARIASEQPIEPKDWMPDVYRENVLR